MPNRSAAAAKFLNAKSSPRIEIVIPCTMRLRLPIISAQGNPGWFASAGLPMGADGAYAGAASRSIGASPRRALRVQPTEALRQG